ncbi:Interferon alpha/beta receptor 1 [Myotis brandtii]|uniref:Interferon alpha/beta receptor 1 n=1 Tax=Myotis brandtii TaxID=109478 RepID=S7P2C9_MYOBR|nr:Interferon alpha/beta receptor 1 [Myotis brandtii]
MQRELANSLLVLGAIGGTKLKPPQNVEVDIIDDTFTLRWARSREPAGNVTVSADYQIPGIVDNWTKLPGCQHVTSATCDFSSLKMNVYEEIKLRIRAEEGDNTSPWRELDTFIPFQQARIGPPKVHLEAEDKAIAINISPPGAEDSIMWQLERPHFKYSVIIWRNASGAQTWNETHHSRFPRIKIHKLVPETTYCVKVKARLLLQRNPAEFSPVHCVSTTGVILVAVLLPDGNVLSLRAHFSARLESSVPAQGLGSTPTTATARRGTASLSAHGERSYLKRTSGSKSEKWAQVQGCERAPVAWCAPPQDVFRKGIYFRVRASRGNSSSPWSEEEKFDAGRQVENELPAPENIQVILENDTYVLKWDYTHDNVTFEAQWLKSYLKRTSGSKSEKWAQVQGCERAPVAWCAPPQDVFRKGIYFRVRASRGNSSSPWSEEEKFDAGRQVVIPPLIVALKPLSSHSLRVSIGLQDQTELQHYPLTYEVSFWENASNTERKTFVEQRADFTVPSLKPRTVYCAIAQALLEDGPRSQPSNTACATTEAGAQLPACLKKATSALASVAQRIERRPAGHRRKTFVEQRADFTVPSLKPRTVYCAIAQALLEDGPRSQPSNTACATTEADSPSQLPAPQNPKIRLYNTEQVLSWEPGSLSHEAGPVVYQVQFKYPSSREWSDVTVSSVGVNCSKISATECDFTPTGQSRGFLHYFNVSLRVRTELPGLPERASAWASVPWFQHYRNGAQRKHCNRSLSETIKIVEERGRTPEKRSKEDLERLA